MSGRRPSLFVVSLFATATLVAQEVALPPKENFHLYLLVGQSNMAGRGEVTPADQQADPRVLMFDREGRWVPAVDPMHWDKPTAGVGLGRTFAKEIAKARPGITIGLIPCAAGGSPIDTWKPGVMHDQTRSYPWDDTVKRATAALPTGTLKGILWHQGESDCKPELAPAYEAKLLDLVARFRALSGSPDVPFLVGQMGKFPDVPWTPEIMMVDAVHRRLPNLVDHCAFVSAEGLAHKGDKIHFDSASYREFGRRYAAAYLRLETVAGTAEADAIPVNGMIIAFGSLEPGKLSDFALPGCDHRECSTGGGEVVFEE